MSQMLRSTIRHGDLVIEFETDGTVQIVRQSNAQGVRLSLTEFNYLVRLADIQGWPVVGPSTPDVVMQS